MECFVHVQTVQFFLCLRNMLIYHCQNIMQTLYLNVPSMFDFFTDYTNVGQTFPLIFYTSYDNVIFYVM